MGGSCRLGQYWLGYSRTSKKIEVAEEVKSGNWCGNDRRERESERDRKNVRERVEKKKGNLDINGCHLSVGGARVCELERYMHLVGRTEREREREREGGGFNADPS
jgi:hypothetical protein